MFRAHVSFGNCQLSSSDKMIKFDLTGENIFVIFIGAEPFWAKSHPVKIVQRFICVKLLNSADALTKFHQIW